ncbi:hypothetical protein [Nostoc sp. NOS(2021)]|uniref:hypothetical protein n=1 Tax=Nostoc sp. NOS(2021) TaxID=2815407 RepID=UPI0025F187FA|nr:hypothetical protein [Nostoc sp. NOS(2021)]
MFIFLLSYLVIQINLQTEVAAFRILEKLISFSPLNHHSGDVGCGGEVAVSISPMPHAQCPMPHPKISTKV